MVRVLSGFIIFLGTLLSCPFLMGQILPVNPGQGAGWEAWDPEQLSSMLLFILGAIASGAVLSYHPIHRGRGTSLAEMDLPKIIITYTVVGALVGIVVAAIPAMGFAIFGIGALTRFRTLLQSAKETGRLILAVVIGIAWGMGAWDLGVMVTVLAWLIILVLDWQVAYRMVVRGLESRAITESSAAYQTVLEQADCRISQVRKNPKKGQASFVFKASRKISREDLEEAFEEGIDPKLQGTVDWPEEG